MLYRYLYRKFPALLDNHTPITCVARELTQVSVDLSSELSVIYKVHHVLLIALLVKFVH